MRKILIIFLYLVILQGCVESFDPKSVSYERLLVVDAAISDIDRAYTVNLSYTYPVDGDDDTPILNANVMVLDGAGNTHVFNEFSNGSYVATDFVGQVGERYQLRFELEGSWYESDWVTMSASPPIDSTHNVYTERLSEEGNDPAAGIQFLVDTHSDNEERMYFRYEWEDTYEIQVPLASEFEFDPVTDTWFRRTEDVGTCYASSFSTDLLIATTAESSENRISDFPIAFIDDESQKLRTRYSILVRQFAISAEAYQFFKEIKKSIENGGSLIDEQVGSISGNIRSLEDPTEIVLGYFEVASSSELRTFFSVGDLDDRYVPPQFQFVCFSPDFQVVKFDSVAIYLEDINPLLRIFAIDSTALEVTLIDRNCSDCTWYTYADNIKPDFWID